MNMIILLYQLVFPFGLTFHSSANSPFMYKIMLAMNDTITPDVSIPGILSVIMVITDVSIPKKCVRKKAVMFNTRTKKAKK